MDPSRLDNTTGMSLVAIGAALGLFTLNVLRRRSEQKFAIGRE
jgi:hypothetical protein